MSCCGNTRVLQINGQTVDFGNLTNAQILALCNTILSNCPIGTSLQLNADGVTLELVDGQGNVLDGENIGITVNAGTTANVNDNTNGSGVVGPQDILHFWSSDGSILFSVVDGSAIVDMQLNPTVLAGIQHTSITGIDLKPTANPNEFLVEITWVDGDGNPQTTTDPTPVTISGSAGGDTVTDVSYDGDVLTVTTDLGSFPVNVNPETMLITTAFSVGGNVYPSGTPLNTIISDLATVSHVPATVTDSPTIDFVITGQDISADVIISPQDLNNTESLADGVYSASSVSKEYCGGGDIDIVQTGLLGNTTSTRPITYLPQIDHGCNEIELILVAVSGASPVNIGNLEVFSVTDNALVGTSTNDITIPSLNLDIPAIYTFSGLSFEGGKEYELRFTSPSSQVGYRRLDDFDPCLPLDVQNLGITPSIRIDSGVYEYKALVSEYFNPDGTFKHYIVKNECTGSVEKTTTLDPSFEDCNYVRAEPTPAIVQGTMSFSGAWTVQNVNQNEAINIATAVNGTGVAFNSGGIEILEGGRYRVGVFFRVVAGSSADASWGVGTPQSAGDNNITIPVDTDFGQPFDFQTSRVLELNAGDIVYPLNRTSIAAAYNFRGGSHITVQKIEV